MMKIRPIQILTTFFLLTQQFICGQEKDSEMQRLVDGELKMTFPSIYFKHNSTEYTAMPYSVDSCFKYIAANVKDLNSYAIWRDSTETEKLTYGRIRKIKSDLNKYTPSNRIRFNSMREAQKIPRHTIDLGVGEKQIQYLLSLNSVLDVSGAIGQSKSNPQGKKKKGFNRIPRLVWCGRQYGFHWK